MRLGPSTLWIAALCAAAASSAKAADGYALIVTNNRSLDPSRPDLQYADDDGAKYAELFAEIYGDKRVVLLSNFDQETSGLYPQWASKAQAPTLAGLDRAVAQLRASLEASARTGARPEVHVVFAGHGDIERGVGYVELVDGRLTAQDLEERIIQRLPAHRLHLILDSCNSYFMLSPRKPGGRRWAASAEAPASLLQRYPNVGAVISTSAEAVTYEWSDLQSGIFSYEVRSGMRGGADVDGDGQVSYPELAAFITVANKPLVNDLYRPKVFSAPPLADATAAIFKSAGGRVLKVPAEGTRRLTLRDARGVRILDLNKEDSTPLTLSLPASEEELGVYETVLGQGDARPTVTYRPITNLGETIIDAQATSPSPFASRGEAPVFRGLFQRPYGKAAFSAVQAELAAHPPLPFGVSTLDAERLRVHLQTGAAYQQEQRTTGSIIIGGAGVLAGIAVLSNAEIAGQPDAKITGRITAGALGAAGIALGTAGLVMPTAQERLYATYATQDLTTEDARARAVAAAEKEFDDQVGIARTVRLATGWAIVGLGAIGTAGGGALLLLPPSSHPRFPGAAAVVVGVVTAVQGVVMVAGTKSPVERAWDLYLADPSVSERSGGPQKIRIELGPGPGLAGVSLSGEF